MSLKRRITLKTLQSKIGEENIFTYYFGEWELGKSYHCPLREDPKKSASFFTGDSGDILLHDFGRGETYNCVRFVKTLYGIENDQDAINQIAIDFDIIEGQKSSNRIPVIDKSFKKRQKKKKEIRVEIQDFTEEDLKYWADRKFTKEDLQNFEPRIYSVKNIYINDFTIKSNDVKFLYLIKGENDVYMKIYSPFAEEWKWMSTAPLNIPFGYFDLKFEKDSLFICKSRKEMMIMQKYFSQYFEFISLQSENKASITDEMMDFLKSKYKKIYYFGDNDEPGILFETYLKERYNIPVFHFPQNQRVKNIKDIDDFYLYYGEDILSRYFRHVGLIK